MRNSFSFGLIIFLLCSIISCTSINSSNFTNSSIGTSTKDFSQKNYSYFQWEEIQEGICLCSYKSKKQNLSWHIVKIDFSKTSLELVFEPKKELNNDANFFSLLNFSQTENALVAINTSPFSIEKEKSKIVGILKTPESLISPPVYKYSAVAFNCNKDSSINFAKILKNQDQKEIENYDFIFGGFFTILENKEILPFANNKRSRSAIGITEDGKTIFLFTCTPIFSPLDKGGLNYEECAEILLLAGASDAMQFDGGKSSALVLKNKILEKPAFQRKIITAIGFRNLE